MINRLIDRITPKYDQLKYRSVFGILFLLSLFIRFPFFFRDYIDRDESTFILMAQSWVDGNLPYTELWDLKPPITFLFFAVIIYIFGKSFIAIRLAGVILVSLTALYSYKIGAHLSNKKTAFWIGFFCVVFQSMFGSIQGVMSEHICMAFLTPAIYLVIAKKEWHWLGLAGLLCGIAIMVKLNMGYTVLFVGLYLVYYFIRIKQIKNGIYGVSAYGIGILAVIALTSLPYYLNGIENLWWKSVVIAPLDYAKASQLMHSVLKLLPTFLIIVIFLFWAFKKKHLEINNSSVQILLVATSGILFSFYKGGRINSHYLIQLYPIFIVLFGVAINSLFNARKFRIHKAFVLLLILLPAESYLELYNVAKHKIERGSFFNGEGITVPKYILEHNINTNNILFFDYHIGYWMLNAKPPTKAATHPSNICKPEMFAAFDNPRKTGIDELRFIMEELQPNTLVLRKGRLVFDENQVEANTYLDHFLPDNYQLRAVVDEAEIFVRL